MLKWLYNQCISLYRPWKVLCDLWIRLVGSNIVESAHLQIASALPGRIWFHLGIRLSVATQNHFFRICTAVTKRKCRSLSVSDGLGTCWSFEESKGSISLQLFSSILYKKELAIDSKLRDSEWPHSGSCLCSQMVWKQSVRSYTKRFKTTEKHIKIDR